MSLINIGNGLSAMGQAVSNSAGEGLENLQKEQLEEQKIKLASQLAGQQYDVQAKQLAAIPQMVSIDTYLKSIGHSGGLADFGVQMPGAGAGPAAPQEAPTNTSAAPVQTSDSAPEAKPGVPSGSGSGSSAAPTNNSPVVADNDGVTGRQAFPQGAPVITPVGDKGKVLGVPLPPGWTPSMAAIAGPTALSAAWEKFSAPGAIRPGGAIPFFNFKTGKMESLYQQPNTPMGSLYDPTTKSYVRIGNADEAISTAAYATSRGTSQGALPAELAKIGASGAQARETAGFQKGLDVATNLVPSYDPATQKTVMITQADALKMTKDGNGPITPPENGARPQPSISGPGLQKDGSYKTADGTIIPAPPPTAKSNGLQAAPSAADKATQESYAPIIKGWEDSVVPSSLAEQRFQAIATAMKATQTGAWQETKQDIAHNLMQYGVLSPDQAKSLLGADVGQAQIILKNNFGAALNTMASTHGLSRFTQNELFATQKNLPAIGNQPEANLAMIGQAIGTARYQQALANDWNQARQLGYADPLTYQAQWTKANPIQKFINDATNEIGPLKGMPAQYPTPPSAAIEQLKAMGPSAKGHFDEIFGPGAAEKVLGQ